MAERHWWMDLHNLTAKERKEQRKQHVRLDFPLPYTISLGAYKCNRSCRMCPMHNMPPKDSEEIFISDEVMRKALEDVGDRRVDLELSAYGDPFLHPHCDEYLDMARRLCPNAHIVVNTNGVLLDEERCRRIVDSGINQLVFSLNTGSQETYRWLTGGEDYDELCRKLEMLVDARNKKGGKHLLIQTHIIGLKQLEHEFEPFIKRWTGVADYAYVRTYGNWAGLVDSNGINPATRQNVPAERYPCAWLWYATKIEPNGDVSKCFVHVVGDKNPVGNIMEKDFIEIWHGERMRQLREMHCTGRWDDLEFCRDCIVWSLFPKFWRKKRKWLLSGEEAWV